jgi:hypothetical protein
MALRKTTAVAAEALLERILHRGEFQQALAAAPDLAHTRGPAEEKAFWFGEVRTLALTCGTDLPALVSQARALLRAAPPEHAYEAGTLAANAFICAGLYTEALAVEPWAARRAAGTEPDDEGQPCLLQINLAEADYNLGRWTEARARLDLLDEAQLGSPLLICGLRCQRAWIGGRLGDPGPAAHFLGTFDPGGLPRLFEAELHFCAAVSHQALGSPDAALEAVERGQAAALRASSRRNGRFLLAWLLDEGGQAGRALAEYQAAADDPYRGQGGDGLLAWGELLHRLGKTQRSRAAWTLAAARDPQSEAAHKARAALGR